MLCQDCEKREATVHLTQVVNEEKVELHLCRECADKRRFHTPFEGVPFPLAEFLASMLDQSLVRKPSKVSDTKCPTCEMYFSDFSKTGRLGCGKCYATFKSQLNDLLRKIHGSSQHRGRAPITPDDVMKPLREERKLQEELKKAIQEENFEQAAQLRDRIRALSSKKSAHR
jgi:protein arginine kinase activator